MFRRLSRLFSRGGGDSDSDDCLPPRRLSVHRRNGSTVDMNEEEVRKSLKKHELIENHKEKTAKLSEIKKKVSLMDEILHELHGAYTDTSSGMTLCMENKYKKMVEDTLDEYNRRLVRGIDEEDDHESTSGYGAMMDDAAYAAKQVFKPMMKGVKGAMKMTGADKALLYVDKAYVKMSSGDIVQDLVFLEEEISRYSIHYKDLQSKFNKLLKSYAEVKKQWCWKRKSRLKDMIEEAILDYLEEENYD